jgi:hypothetical protein
VITRSTLLFQTQLNNQVLHHLHRAVQAAAILSITLAHPLQAVVKLNNQLVVAVVHQTQRMLQILQHLKVDWGKIKPILADKRMIKQVLTFQ